MISDVLPPNVSYISSTLSVPYNNITTTIIAGQTIVTYNGISLNPGQQAILTIQ